MDPLKILPTEITEKIFSYLSLKDLTACCLVSQKWNFAASNDKLWKGICVKNGWRDCGSLQKHSNSFSFLNNDGVKHYFNNMGEWRKHFILKNQLQKNWRCANTIDYDIYPPKQVDDNDVGNVSSVSSDGRNLLAFGFEKGLLSLFSLENNSSNLLVNKNCPLNASVDYIEIINEYLVLIQENLFLMYKLVNTDLELYRAKIINTSVVTDLDLDTLVLMDTYSRTEFILRTKETFDDDVLYHFTESHLVITTNFSENIYIYDINSDFIEPSVVFNLKEIEIETSDKFILSVHNRSDTLYVLLSVSNNSSPVSEDDLNLSKFSIYALSINSRKLLFSNNLVNNEFIGVSQECKIETNDRFLVLRFETLYNFVFDRVNGNLLLSEEGLVFLNANSNPSYIGVWMGGTFRVMDPSNLGCYFCCSSDNTPIAMFSDILITSSVEFDRDGKGTTYVEFWYVYSGEDMYAEFYETEDGYKKDVIKFPKNSNVALIYKDDTKLIFYVERDRVLVRSFLA